MWHYVARCKNCGHIGKKSNDITWMNRFFLPSMCENCGESIGWEVKKRRWVRVMNWFNPFAGYYEERNVL